MKITATYSYNYPKPIIYGDGALFPVSNSKAVKAAVCEYFEVTVKELEGPSRVRNVTTPRMLAMCILRDLGLTFPQIGRSFGGRDHTTAINAVRKRDKFIQHIGPIRRRAFELGATECRKANQ